MVGPWFPTPWRLVSQSQGSVAWCLQSYFPYPAVFATPRCPFPLCHIWPLAVSPYLSPHPVFLPNRAASSPMTRAHWILIHPGTVFCVLHGSLLFCPLVFGLFDSYWTLWGPFFLAPPPFPILLPAPIPHQAACIPCVYPTLPFATLWPLPAVQCLVACADCPYPFSRCLFAQCCGSSDGALTLFCQVLFFPHPVGRLPPPFPLCVRALSCGFLSPLCVFFYPLPACTHLTTALVIGLQLPSVFVSGPLFHEGRSPW